MTTLAGGVGYVDLEFLGVQRIIAAAKKNNLPVGRPVTGAAQIQEGLKQGFTFFQGPSDMVMMRTGAEGLLKPFGKWDTAPKDRPSY